MDMLTLSHVQKSFGNHEVLKDLSFSVPEHSLYGFIGQNGSGKTTTMKLILGLLKANAGTITVNGIPVYYGQNKTNRFIGYLPDVPEFYNFMTPMEYLTFCGEITGMDANQRKHKSAQLLDLVGLDTGNRRIHGFSRGMKQRLGIAQALLNSPKLLICDEPTSALDPAGRKEILDILLSVKEYTTVLFSTHILSDVERICDEIAFLHNGSIALHGSLEEIRQMHKTNGLELDFFHHDDLRKFLFFFPDGQPMGKTRLHYEKKSEQDLYHMMQCLVTQQISIQKIERLEPTLESLFMEVIAQ